MRRVVSLFGSLMLAVVISTAACSSSGSSKTNPGPGSPGTTIAPGSTSGKPSTTPCTIPQNNGGDHDSDNNGGPNDGDGCDV